MSHSVIEAQAPYPWQRNCWLRLTQQFSNDALPHAVLLCGPGGIGKHNMLRQFARMMLCLNPDNSMPCGHCRNCQLSDSGEHPDILTVAPAEGARDIGVNQIRDLSDFVLRTSHTGIAKVVVIQDAHRMNQSAANALLKTLEEPARNTYLFLESELPGYLSATIRSRCQRIVMSLPEFETSVRWLEEFLQPDEDAAALLATVGGRPMRALELAESGELQERKEFAQGLEQLLNGNTSAENAVQLGNKLGPLIAVEALSVFLSTLITDRLSNPNRGNSDKKNNRAELPRLRRFFDLYNDSLQARKQLLGTANPNPQLILESLLWRLGKLAAQGRGKSAA